jgi:hypothetical protein
MGEEEVDLLPFSFLKKYGGFLISIREVHKMQALEAS